MHGLYDLANKSYIQTCFLSPLLMTMKGYCFGYLQRKAAPPYFNIINNREDEGNWITVMKYALGTSFLPIYKENVVYLKNKDGSIKKDNAGNPIPDPQKTWDRVSVGVFINTL